MQGLDVLVLPGWMNSGAAHWQSRWEALYGYRRVQQHDWQRPLRGDWMARLEEVVLAAERPVLLAAHSLGCLLAAAWAGHSRSVHRVQGALLVAPPDVERPPLSEQLPGWAPVPARPLPFRSIVVGSRDDPYADASRIRAFAAAWGAEGCVDIGAAGHINADSGLGEWPAGHALLRRLAEPAAAAAATPAPTSSTPSA